EQDGFAAVALVEGMGPLQVALVEEERVLAIEEARTDAAAEGVPDADAGDGADQAQHAQQADVEVALRGQDAGREQQAVTRPEEADEEARLGEDDEGDANRPDRPNERLQIYGQHKRTKYRRGQVRDSFSECRADVYVSSSARYRPCSTMYASTAGGDRQVVGWAVRPRRRRSRAGRASHGTAEARDLPGPV